MQCPLMKVALVLGLLALWTAQARAEGEDVSQGQEYHRFRQYVEWSE